jgi:uncharacterized membrane protein YfcA
MVDHVQTLPLRPLNVRRIAAVVGLLAFLALAGAAIGGSFGAFNPLYAGSGLAVGVLVGLTGVGGGSLMTPLLVLLFGFHPATAVGTDLLFASATKGVGTAVHGANKTVDWKITGLMAAGSVPAAAATLTLLWALHTKASAVSSLISTVLGGMLVVTAIALLFRERMFAFARQHTLPLSDRGVAIATVVLGALLGVLVTISSVGAGAIGVTVLIFLYPRMAVSRVVGSDIAHAVPLTLLAGMGHWMMGSVNVPLLASLLVGSVPGIVIGSQLTPRTPEKWLRPILAGVLILVAAKMFFG